MLRNKITNTQQLNVCKLINGEDIKTIEFLDNDVLLAKDVKDIIASIKGGTDKIIVTTDMLTDGCVTANKIDTVPGVKIISGTISKDKLDAALQTDINTTSSMSNDLLKRVTAIEKKLNTTEA